jgi:DNA-binding FadR family transcriptional regulator
MSQPTAVAAVFEPVQAPTTFEETVERLGTAIRLGLLGAGTRLPPERELADQLGISRSTLRQAITTLVQSGHLQSVRGRGGGTFVVERPPLVEHPDGTLPRNWREILDLRLAIECGAILLAADRADADDLRRLDELVQQMATAPPFAVYRRADMRFHIGLAEAARAPRLIHSMTEVQAEVAELIALIPHPDAVLTHSNDEHRRLVEALRRHDGEAAVVIMRRHLGGTEHILAGLRPG